MYEKAHPRADFKDISGVAKRPRRKNGLADLNAMLSAAIDARQPPNGKVDLAHHKRQLVADLCRLLGQRLNAQKIDAPIAAEPNGGAMHSTHPLPDLSPRMRQTLDRLLAGDSEKQIAIHLGLSRHTVHVYVKAIYRGFGVSSRGELLSRFVKREYMIS